MDGLTLIRKRTVEECGDDVHQGVDDITFQGSVEKNKNYTLNKKSDNINNNSYNNIYIYLK